MTNFKTKITREMAAEYGRQAVQITESGEYRTSSGQEGVPGQIFEPVCPYQRQPHVRAPPLPPRASIHELQSII